jgi:cytochrome c oxidase subunit 2
MRQLVADAGEAPLITFGHNRFREKRTSCLRPEWGVEAADATAAKSACAGSWDQEGETVRSSLAATAVFLAALMAGAVVGDGATAAEPLPWQIGFQPAASPVMERLNDFHNLLLVIITLIALFVLGLLVYVMWRFSEERNPTPSKTTHNTLVEVLWTVIPVIILVIIAIPSFRLLYYADRAVDADMTLKVVGRQWYWTYQYPDQGDIEIDSTMIPDEEITEGQRRLLEVDNRLVLPVDTTIRILVTASDVLHNFAMPSMGLKLDAVPGRTNETWTRILREGVYFGQCSELCGVGHAYMPIAIEAVSKQAFDKWVETAQSEGLDAAYERLARLKAEARLARDGRGEANELTVATAAAAD